MAETPEIQAPQAGKIVVVNQVSVTMTAPQLTTMAVYNVPADAIHVTYGAKNIAYTRIAQTMDVTQGLLMAVVRGKVDNTKLVAWTYTLDGHDYYVLRLGSYGRTLVFDLSTEQWSWWSSPESFRWRPNIGMNWYSSGAISEYYGSNVIVGDDSYGVLYALDPEQGADDPLLGDVKYTFPRQATGQISVRGRSPFPVYSAYLTASLGNPSVTPNTVTLEYSDDQGRSWIVADEPQVMDVDDFLKEFVWRSMGQVRAPGRLFRITDDGAFARIDSLDVNNESE